MEGFNGTIFAYGQTSSGKTHTLMGNAADPGITMLSIQDVFDGIAKTPDTEFLVRISYVELYNEEIKDLLRPKSGSSHGKGLKIVDDPKHGPKVRRRQRRRRWVDFLWVILGMRKEV
jgi:hypothetical protein